MHCREILFTPRGSPRVSEFARPVNFSLRRRVVELRGIKVAQFSDFGLFSPYKTPKTYLPVTSLQPRGYIAEWLRFFQVVVEGPNGWRHQRFPATFGRGDGDSQTCPNFCLWQMAISMQNATTPHIRSGPKMSENAQFWGRMYFPTKYLRPYPQIHSKTPFWGTFQCKAYTQSSP